MIRRGLPPLTSRTSALVMLALTTFCLAVFALSIPMPRVDGQLVGSDGTRYYVYLPSVLLDRDLDFTDEYAFFYGYDPHAAERIVANRTPTGRPANRLGVGPALLWLPFFASAHLLVWMLGQAGLDIQADGTGTLYQAAVLIGSILYGGIGAWLALRAARHVAGERAALTATLITILAGNAIYYMTVEPSMSHTPSMFAASAFFYLWLRRRDGPTRWSRAGLGALAGLMALVRPQDGLLLALPILDEALSARQQRRGLTDWLWATVTLAGPALVVFSPQLLVWKLLNGGYLRSGYSNEVDELVRWSGPRFFEVLVDAPRGLFVWHPVFLVALAGLWWVARRDRRLAALCFLGFAIQWTVVSGWHDRIQGDAFGGRMFIVCTPIFILGMAAALERLGEARAWRAVLAGGTVLIVLNLLLLVHYRLELMDVRQALTYSELLFGRFRVLF